jgi:hypothetical protein
MKVDLAELEQDVRAWVFKHDETLALIRVARAAKNLTGLDFGPEWDELTAALSDIEDSKHD